MRPSITKPEVIALLRRAALKFELLGTCDLIDGISAWWWTRKILGIREPRFIWNANVDHACLAMNLAALVLKDRAGPSKRSS